MQRVRSVFAQSTHCVPENPCLPRCSSHSNPDLVGPALCPTNPHRHPHTLFDLVWLRISAVHFVIVLKVEFYREN